MVDKGINSGARRVRVSDDSADSSGVETGDIVRAPNIPSREIVLVVWEFLDVEPIEYGRGLIRPIEPSNSSSVLSSKSLHHSEDSSH